MGKYNVSIPNLLGGISKQSPSIRAENQMEDILNCICDPVTGLRRRHSAEFITELADSKFLTEKAAIHCVNRENKESYAIAIDAGELQVYDLDTGAKGVIVEATEGALQYIKAANSKASLRFTSVNDFTFIMNTEIVPRSVPTKYLDSDVFKADVYFKDGTATPASSTYKLGICLPATQYGARSSLPEFAISGSYWNNRIFKYFDTYDALKLYMSSIYFPSFSIFAGGVVSVPKGEYVSSRISGIDWSIANPYRSQTVSELTGWSAELRSRSGDPYVQDDPYYSYYKLILTNTPADPMDLPYPNNMSKFEFTVTSAGFPSGAPIEFDAFIVNVVDGARYLGPGDEGDPSLVYYNGHPSAEGLANTLSGLDVVYDIKVNGIRIPDSPGVATNAKAAYFRDKINANPELNTKVVASVEVINGENVLRLQNNPNSELKVVVDRRNFAEVKYTLTAPQEKVYVIVKQGVADQIYQFSVNGKHAFYTTGTTDQPATWRTNAVAAGLKAKVDTWGGGYTCEQFGNLLRITVPPLAPGEVTTFDYVDTWNSQAMYVTKSNLASTADLPFRFIEGVPLQIGKQSDGYYLQYVRSVVDTGRVKGSLDYQIKVLPDVVKMGHLFPTILNTVSHSDLTWTAVEGDRQGVWEECAKPYLVSHIDPATMPHVLINLGGGKFELRAAVWNGRKVGDEKSSPMPSFIDKSVQDIFFFKNRLGILTEDTIVLSQVGSYFDFFADTVREVLDDAPLDIQIASEDASTLLRAIPFSNSVLIFSDKSQYKLASSDVFTPNSAAVAPAGRYSFNDALGVHLAGNSLFFSGKRSNTLQLWQMSDLGDSSGGLVSTNINLHVEGLVPADVNIATVSPESRSLVLSTAGSTDLYMYQWLTGQGNEAQQSSWIRWRIGGVQAPKSILMLKYVRSTLYVLTLSNTGGVQLLKVNSNDNVVDSSSSFATVLDFKVAVSGSNTITVPAEIKEDPDLVFINTASGEYVVPEGNAGATFTLSTAGDYVAGVNFKSMAILSTYYAKDKNGNSDVDAYITIQTAITTQHGEGTKHKLRIKYKSGEADKVAKSNEDTRKTTRSLVQARNINNTVIIENDGAHPFYIQAINYEIDVKVRTYRA